MSYKTELFSILGRGSSSVQVDIHDEVEVIDKSASPVIIFSKPLTEEKPPRKRPKTQGDLRLDVQEIHLEVLKKEKEKMEIEKENLLLQRRKLELQIQLLERNVGSLPPNQLEESSKSPLSPAVEFNYF